MPNLIAPAWPVAAPAYLPPLHSLVASAVTPPDDTGRWESGIVVEPEGWAVPHVIPGMWCGGDYEDVVGPKPVESPPDLVYYSPFGIVTSYHCDFGRTWVEMQEKVRRQLAAVQSKAIEQAVWDGAISHGGVALTTNFDGSHDMQLAKRGTGAAGALTALDRRVVRNPGYDPALGLNTVTAVDLANGLALLGSALGTYGSGAQGMIHMPVQPGELAASGQLLTEDRRGGTPILRTRGRGDTVVIGSGYSGTGPGGDVPAANRVWLHATSMIQLRLGSTILLPDTEAQGFNRATNQRVIRAEQVAAAYWDGLTQFSVLVDLTKPWATFQGITP